MIYSIYLNPTIDKTYYFKCFNSGQTNRPLKAVLDGAGKAINVSVVLKTLKQKVMCIGINFIDNGEIIIKRLKKYGIKYDFVDLQGSARVNTKIFDISKKEITEINEKGLFISKDSINQVLLKLYNRVEKGDIVILTGSLPSGSDTSLYGEIIEQLKYRGIKCVLDADGNALALGIRKHPFLIKTNLYKLKSTLNLQTENLDDIAGCARKLADECADIVAVSMGKDGAVISDGQEVYYARPVQVDIKSTVGAGDSMLAGIVSNLEPGIKYALKCGTAAALASICTEGTKLMSYDDYIKVKDMVEVVKI